MTEQEQTKQMLKTLCDKFQCSAIDRSYMAKSCRQCEDIIEALHEAGYGDISEYKAEIERLKAEKTQLQIDTINTIIKYCENPNHWNELKNCKLWGGKSDDLRDFLNRIFKENNDENTWIL